MEQLKAAAAVCGAFASIWGVVLIVRKIIVGIQTKADEFRAKRNAPMLTLMGRMEDMNKEFKKRSAQLDRMEEVGKKLQEAVGTIGRNVDDLDKSVATLQADRLNQGYEYYVEDQNPCPLAIKGSLTRMCEQYTSKGHNHLHESYIERLEQCPTK